MFLILALRGIGYIIQQFFQIVIDFHITLELIPDTPFTINNRLFYLNNPPIAFWTRFDLNMNYTTTNLFRFRFRYHRPVYTT